MTDKKDTLIKNIAFKTPLTMAELVDYAEGRVVSRTLSAQPHVNITLFAFDEKEEISAHTSPGDAMVQILDGEALVHIDGEAIRTPAGKTVVMPANVPHSVTALTRMKMLLTVVKQGMGIKGL